MLDHSPSTAQAFALDADQIAMHDMAKSFADETFAPNALAWDEARHFPVAEMRKAAALGMGGVFIAEEFGGSELSRLTGDFDLRGAGDRLPDGRGLYVDP